MDALPRSARVAAGLLTLAIVLVGCTGTAVAPSTPSSAQPSDPPSASPSGSPDTPVSAEPSDGAPVDPAPVGAKPVLPKPGQLDLHPVPADSLTATVDGSTIKVRAVWTSGVEPCNVLDSIVADKGAGTYTITLREGHGPEEVFCVAIAEQHVTEFEIPDVEPGTWKIVDQGGLAPEVEVTVG